MKAFTKYRLRAAAKRLNKVHITYESIWCSLYEGAETDRARAEVVSDFNRELDGLIDAAKDLAEEIGEVQK